MPTVTSENITQYKMDQLAKQGIIKPMTLTEEQLMEPKIKKLGEAVDQALAEHLAMPRPAQVANSKRARAVIGQFVSNKKGKPVDLLGQTKKLEKAEEGTDETDPVILPDGRGVVTKGLALSPAYEEGGFSTCPNSKSCKSSCLGKTSGGYFFAGGGQDLDKVIGPRLLTFKKTQALLRNPKEFAVRMYEEIRGAKTIAEQNGNHLGIRLNVLSDLHPRVWESLIKAHPDVTFYDYTKNATRSVAPNHHLTYSSTGISTDQVNNQHQNWKRMRTMLDMGNNVAMAFSHKSQLPHEVHDQETGKRYKVIDGDTHDFRPLDLVPEGQDGVIIGLKNKAATTSEKNATEKSKGFFVPYDPQYVKGKRGVLVRDEAGNPLVQNRTATIPPQPKSAKNVDNDGAALA